MQDLTKSFSSKMQASPKLNIRTTEDPHANKLGHSSIFAPREKNAMPFNFEMRRVLKLPNSFHRLFAKTSCGCRETSRRHLTSIEPLCFNSFQHRVFVDEPYFGTDHLFKNEVARKVYLKSIRMVDPH